MEVYAVQWIGGCTNSAVFGALEPIASESRVCGNFNDVHLWSGFALMKKACSRQSPFP
jgi:hypothetical protein